jgi:hypothetical protein
VALRARLKARREELDLGQDVVGVAIGKAIGKAKISDALVGHYETGERPLKIEHLRPHLRILQLPESWADDLRDARLIEDNENLMKKAGFSDDQKQLGRLQFLQQLRVRRE